jgi:hypothetical protein
MGDDEDRDEDRKEIEAMFVQTADGVRRGEDGTMTLIRLAPATLYFSDRPDRLVGHLSAQHFIDLWEEGENSFAKDPPNAVLAFPNGGGLSDTVVILRDPKLEGDQITYKVDVLEADLPDEAGACTLFIDPLGRPLSPMSVAGVHRRGRRRAGRMV